MIKDAKRYITIFLILSTCLFLFSCSFVSNSDDFDEISVQTEFGDIFNLSFDSYKVTTIVQHNESDFYLVFDRKIDAHDIIGIKNNSEIKAYRIDDVIFYDNGNGFVQFDGDLSSNTIITDLVKSNLLVSYCFFKNNIDYYYSDSLYKTEIKSMLNSICNKEYKELSCYGLTKETLENTSDMEHIEQLAKDLLSGN